MKQHTKTPPDDLTASIPIKILYRSIATGKLLKEEETTVTVPISPETMKQFQAVARRMGTPMSEILFRFVAEHFSNRFRDTDNKALQEELEALRLKHGEFETFVQPTGDIHIHSGKPKH